MSFLSLLSPAITAASDVAGGYEQGQQKAKAQQIAQAQLAAKEKRQSALDILNARNINSEITTREREKQGAGSTVISQEGEIYEKQPDGSYSKAKINDPTPAPISPTSATGGPSGDINLGTTTGPSAPVAPGPTKSSDAGPAVAPPTPIPQGATPPKQSAPQGTAPKFGPRKANDPNSPESIKADSVKSANAARNQNEFGFHPGPTNVFLPSVDSTGKTTYTTVQNRGNPNPSPTGLIKPQTGVGGSGSKGAASSLREMIDSDANMTAMEPRVIPKMTTTQELAATSAAASAHATSEAKSGMGGLLSIPGQALGAFAGQHILDPDVAEYDRNGRSFGMQSTQALKGRQSDQKVTRDIQLSRVFAANKNNPNVAQDTQGTRRNLILMAAADNPEQVATLTPQQRDRLRQLGAPIPPEATFGGAGAPVSAKAQQVRMAKGKGAPVTGGPPGNINLGKPQITSQEQYDAAIQAGHPDSVISHLYTIPPTIKRRQ